MSEWREAIDEAIGKKWRIGLTIIGVLIVIYLISGLIFGMWPFSIARGIIQKTTSAEAVIGNYQWFYDQYNAIEAQRVNYNSMPADAVERTGLRMVLNSMIAEYNSRSKQITRNLWKASDLPYSISLEGASR